MKRFTSKLLRESLNIQYKAMHSSNSCKNLCSVLRRCLVEEPDIEKIEEQTVSVRSIDDDPEMTITTKIHGTPRHYHRRKTDTLMHTLKRMRINLTQPHHGKKKLKKSMKTLPTEIEGLYYPDDVKIEVRSYCSAEKVPLDTETSNQDAWKEQNVLIIGEEMFKIRVNAPTVVAIDIPKHLMVGFPVVPSLELEFGKREDAKFLWFRGRTVKNAKKVDMVATAKENSMCCELNMAWEFLANTFKYTPSVSDIGYKLKFICIPRNRDAFGFSQEVISEASVGAGPGACPFEERHLYTMKKTETPNALRVVSYNILADIYADTEFARENMYPYCSPYAIAFDYRGQLILKEIIGYNSDILCLQECDLKVFLNFLHPAMKEEGFEGSFLRKGGEMPEGEAIFYRKARFTELKKSNVIISEALYQNCNRDILNALEEHPSVLESLKKRTAVGQVMALQDISRDRVLCILNTHLYFRPEATNIRLLQMAVLLNHFRVFIDDIKGQFAEKVVEVAPLICGDFNSTPKLAVIEYLTSGKICNNHSVWTQKNEEEDCKLDLQHDFEFFSACGYPRFTNYVVGFKDTLDYIVADSNHFKVESCVPFPDEEFLQLHTALPSVTIPSDHLALVCDLVWLD